MENRIPYLVDLEKLLLNNRIQYKRNRQLSSLYLLANKAMKSQREQLNKQFTIEELFDSEKKSLRILPSDNTEILWSEFVQKLNDSNS